MTQTYTVFGVFDEDPAQRYSTCLEADSPQDAEKRAVAGAPAAIRVAAVLPGPVQSLVSAENIPTIHGKGYETSVALVRVRYKSVRLPHTCLRCFADLRAPESVWQWDYWDYYWEGRIPRGTYKGDFGITVNHDKGVRTGGSHEATITAVVLQCVVCKYELWNGYEEET